MDYLTWNLFILELLYMELPSQFKPFPVKPSLQLQTNEPTVSMQLAFGWHRSSEHSSISKSLELIKTKKSISTKSIPYQSISIKI